MKTNPVVLSVCDGMSCLRIAMQEMGIIPAIYYASEIDKFAISQTQLNFPDTIQLGDMSKIDVSKLEQIDILSGGTPCTNFSFAGKRKGMSTKCDIKILTLDQYLELKEQGFQFEGQSYLFWEYMRILNDIRKYNPEVIFLLENVEMGDKWEGVLSKAIGLYGVHINSNLVSAQNRKRIYWSNIKTKQSGLFGEFYTDIPQPKDQGVYLKDILEDEVDEKYYISQAVLNRIERKTYSNPKFNPDESGTLNTKNNSGQMSIDSGTTFVVNDKGKIRTTEKSNAIDANYFKGIDNHAQRSYVSCVAMRGRNPENPSDRRTGSPTEQRLEANTTGKTNCLTSVQKDNLIMTSNYLQVTGTNFDSDYRFWKEDGKHAACVTRGFEKTGVITKSRIRRLTPLEVSRLQTVPDWYKWECSDTQIYKMCGNGWTIEVIKWILSFLNIN